MRLTLASLILWSSPGLAVVRVWKYEALTQVHADRICVFARHEHSPVAEYRRHPFNGREALACRLTVAARAGDLTLQAAKVQTFPYEKLTKTCISFAHVLPPRYKLTSFEGLKLECALATAAARVFALH